MFAEKKNAKMFFFFITVVSLIYNAALVSGNIWGKSTAKNGKKFFKKGYMYMYSKDGLLYFIFSFLLQMVGNKFRTSLNMCKFPKSLFAMRKYVDLVLVS